MERVEQKDQKVGKYEDGSELVIGALYRVDVLVDRLSLPPPSPS